MRGFQSEYKCYLTVHLEGSKLGSAISENLLKGNKSYFSLCPHSCNQKCIEDLNIVIQFNLNSIHFSHSSIFYGLIASQLVYLEGTRKIKK